MSMTEIVGESAGTKPLSWLHKSEFYAEKIMAMLRLYVERPGIGDVIRHLVIEPRWGGAPLRLKVVLTPGTSPTGTVSLPSSSDHFHLEAAKTSPEAARRAVLRLIGHAVMGHVRPGQILTITEHTNAPEAEDADLFARHMIAKLDRAIPVFSKLIH